MSPIAIVPPLVLVVLLIVAPLVARRAGYRTAPIVVVRRSMGHLFATIWVPGASFKAIRLGWFRLQRCPVGNHWTFVTPVRDSDLTDEERQFAEEYHDVWVP